MQIKQLNLWLPSLLALILVPWSCWLLAQERPPVNPAAQPSAGQTQDQAQLVLYYGDGCPHCKIVEEYLAGQTNVETLSLVRKEVYNDSANQQELIERAGVCGIRAESIGIPLLWDGQTQSCLVGDQDIIANLKTRLQ